MLANSEIKILRDATAKPISESKTQQTDDWKRIGIFLVQMEIKKGKASFETVSKGNLESQRHDVIIQKITELEDLLEKEAINNRHSKFTRDKLSR